MPQNYLSTTSIKDWKSGLANKKKQWKPGYSAYELANCWEKPNKQGDFPNEVRQVFEKHQEFQGIQPLVGVVEYKVHLANQNNAPSQNDIFILARAKEKLVSIMVEGKVDETFDQRLGAWIKDASQDKRLRLKDISQLIVLPKLSENQEVRYQLLHRMASAVIEAKRFRASYAIMLIHSFSKKDPQSGLSDFANFVKLYDSSREVKPNELVSLGTVSFGKSDSIQFMTAWVNMC